MDFGVTGKLGGDYLAEQYWDDADTSAVNWKPTGAEPEATSPQVQSRWNSTLGQKSIIVPSELEEKMKNDPELAKKVMANVENFITTYTATSVRPGRVCSWLNGESALKRRLMEQETDERYYQTSITQKAVSIAAYEAAGILK